MINTVCLCGSTRFIDGFNEANVELTKRGLSVITISMALPKNEQGTEEETALKLYLDLVHLNKILRADAILVVGPGYFGVSTAREILWAKMQGKMMLRSMLYDTWDLVARDLLNGVSDVSLELLARVKLGLISANEARGTLGLEARC